jgi:hypothetical protein
VADEIATRIPRPRIGSDPDLVLLRVRRPRAGAVCICCTAAATARCIPKMRPWLALGSGALRPVGCMASAALRTKLGAPTGAPTGPQLGGPICPSEGASAGASCPATIELVSKQQSQRQGNDSLKA